MQDIKGWCQYTQEYNVSTLNCLTTVRDIYVPIEIFFKFYFRHFMKNTHCCTILLDYFKEKSTIRYNVYKLWYH